jgi:hypothetical protein
MEFLFRLYLEGIAGVVEAVHGPTTTGPWAPYHDILRARNGWIGAIATVMFIVGGVAAPLLLSPGVPDGWLRLLPIGVGCGAAVLLPYLWICLATLPFGLGRYREYWLFYRLHYGIGPERVLILCLPFAILGAISMIVLLGLVWLTP